jgi:hypothetical protein
MLHLVFNKLIINQNLIISIHGILAKCLRWSIYIVANVGLCSHFIDQVSVSYDNISFIADLYISNFVEHKLFQFQCQIKSFF